MTMQQIKSLIQGSPDDLYKNAFTDGCKVQKAAEDVLRLHRESKTATLSAADRVILKERLVEAAHRVDVLIALDDTPNFRPRFQRCIRNDHRALFSNIADELGESVQRLQANLARKYGDVTV